jgi:hypothetical protein
MVVMPGQRVDRGDEEGVDTVQVRGGEGDQEVGRAGRRGDEPDHRDRGRVLVGGHTWPGATIHNGPGVTTPTISATAIMWRFFLKHLLR